MNTVRPRVAIVSDPLVQRGGAERCVEILAQTFPDAPIFATLYSAETGPASIADRVIASGLNKIPGATKRHRFLLPLFPSAIESFDLSEYDVVISSHHTAAKGLLRSAKQYHICYCYTPMRALWERPFEEVKTLPALARPLAMEMFRQLRVWDYATVGRVDEFVGISRTTCERIAKHYGRESGLLFPPIDTARFTPGAGEPGDYYFLASRLVPYKRVDLAVAATAKLGRKLVVVGGGPGVADVRAPHVDYRGHVSDDEVVALMRGARAMIFPAFEDFGMAPVETMACGRPVVGLNRGGTAETVIDGVTGVLATEQTVDGFAEALLRLERGTFDPVRIREHAETFSREVFSATFRELVRAGYERVRG